MEVVKPSLLHCSCLPFARRGQMFQSLTASLGFDLLTGQVLPPQAAWNAVMECLPEGWCLDSGLPKPKAEWLLAGFARSPDQKSHSQMTVEVRVGQSVRRFLVRGPAFNALPLRWEYTQGGPQSPQIVDADRADSRPACPGPREAGPCRMRGMGSFDAQWLHRGWPGLPDDNDGSYLNLAQPQQQLPSGLAPDAVLQLHGLHEQYPVIRSALPGLQVQVCRLLHDGSRQSFPVMLDTLWLFPDRLTGLLLWHSLVPCADEAASDVRAVVVSLDPPGDSATPKPAAEQIEPQPSLPSLPAQTHSPKAHFKGTNMAGRDLTGQDLSGQDFSGQDLSSALLDGADLSGADLRRACLRAVQAKDADFSHCLLEGADFRDADCTGALLQQVQGQGLQAQGARFDKAALRQSTFEHANFSGAMLRQADVSACCLDKAHFQEADCRQSTFGGGTSALNSTFTRAVLTESQWQEVKAPQSLFTQTQAHGASFTACDFSHCDWSKSRAEGTRFLRCDLRKANLRGAHLLRASFHASRLEGACCARCNMYGADFCWCQLDAATDLQDALLGCTLLSAQAAG